MANNNSVKFIRNTESISSYLSDVRKFDVLSAEEEKELFTRYKNGDMSARDEIIAKNQRFIYSNAKVYAANEDELLDYVQEGNIGLMKAIEDFDVERGYKFITFAVWYIKREMNYYMNNFRDMIVKSNNMKFGKKIDKIKADFLAKEERYPSIDEIKERMMSDYNLDVKDTWDLMDVTVESINVEDDDENTMEDSSDFAMYTASYNGYDAECDNHSDDDIKDKVRKLMDLLPNDDYRETILNYFGIGCDAMSIDEIACDRSMNPEQIQKIINNTLKYLKENGESIVFKSAAV